MTNIRIVQLLTLLCLQSLSFIAHTQVNINDPLTNRTQFIDNSLLTRWGANTGPATAFTLLNKADGNGLSYSSIAMLPSILNTSDAGYTASNSLKTLTSIDYPFPSVVNRNTHDIVIEFDAIWDALQSSGENGRLVVTLMDSYPPGGAQFGQVDDVSLHNPFGRPLYNIRIRNNSIGSSNGPMMLYGAGTIPEPEWEVYGTGPWWLPGFSVQAGGGSPGSGPDYPVGGTKKSTVNAASTTTWRHYKWVIKAERMELYYRNSSQTASNDQLIFFMQIPRKTSDDYVISQINAAHGTSITTPPPNYNWFGSADAVRFYWRGVQNTYLSNVRIYTQAIVPLPNALTSFTARHDQQLLRLAWTDLSTDVAYYEVEEGNEQQAFTKTGVVHAANGQFSFSYSLPASPLTRYFRIRSVANNGDRSLLSKTLKVEGQARKTFYKGPNPVNEQLRFEQASDGTINYQLRNALGQVVQEGKVQDVVPLKQLPAGSYRLLLIKDGTLIEETSLIKR